MREVGVAGRMKLRRAAVLARAQGLAVSRSARFAARMEGRPPVPFPSLSDLRQWPEWPALPHEDRFPVFALTALLAGRDALANLIAGSELRRYAEACGEVLFEQALGLDGGGRFPLPDPSELAAAGEELARNGLPPRLADRLGCRPAGDAEAARHVAEAERLLNLHLRPSSKEQGHGLSFLAR